MDDEKPHYIKRHANRGRLLLVLWLVIFVTGCVTNTITMDLAEYVNQGILNISSLEKRAFVSYSSVTGENYTSDQAVYEALKDEVIPIYERFVYLLKKVECPEEEIKQIHVIYIEGSETIERGFKIKLNGLEQSNESSIIKGNEEIIKGYAITEKWRGELLKLYEKYGVRQVDGKNGKKETEPNNG